MDPVRGGVNGRAAAVAMSELGHKETFPDGLRMSASDPEAGIKLIGRQERLLVGGRHGLSDISVPIGGAFIRFG
jgi:hypothetical protein